MADPIVPLHVGCHVTLRLIAVFGKRDFTSYLNILSEKQEWSQYNLSWTVNCALDTSAINTFTNRPLGSFKVLIWVLVLASYLWWEKRLANLKLFMLSSDIVEIYFNSSIKQYFSGILIVLTIPSRYPKLRLFELTFEFISSQSCTKDDWTDK